jgi:hypothetical protein
MVRNEKGDGVEVMYKDDSSLPGWLPRPALPNVRMHAWAKHFKGKTSYLSQQVLHSYPLKVMKSVDGITQRTPHWVYDVKHANGEVHSYTIPVDSLPIPQFSEDIHALVKNALPQKFHGKLRLRRNQVRVRSRIDQLLTKRGKNSDQVKLSWDDFFNRLPKEDDMDRPHEYPNILSELARNYGHKLGNSINISPLKLLTNTISFSVPYSSPMIEVANDEHHDYGPIDSIHYKGGPISQKEHAEFRRQHFSDGHKLAIRKRKYGNDDSESDNSDDSEVYSSRPRAQRRVMTKHTAKVPDVSLDDAKVSGGVLIPKKKSARIHSKSNDGISWSGIRIPSIQKLLEETFGESRNGRIRVKLYAQKKLLRTKGLLLDVFQCTSETELLDLLKNGNSEHFKFEFYYKSEGYLYSCISPDGLCGPRNFAALQKGIILKLFHVKDKAIIQPF